ncbi:MAG TPA: hypothetical protein VGN08_08755 [Solirubrobacteraceae bacterium]|jgi:hypothetical protein
MAQISRPFQIALVAFGLLVAVWFFALRGHSSTTASSSSAPPAAQPSAAAQAEKAAAPSRIYHGPAPGVNGLTRAVAKAHEAVATSQTNAKQLEQKSAQASSVTPQAGGAGTSATPAGSAAGTRPSGIPAATRSSSVQGKAAGKRAPTPTSLALQRSVEAQLKQGKIAVLLFWNKKGADDVVSRDAVQQLRHGHDAAKVAVHESPAGAVASYGTITTGVQIYSTPTILIINQRHVATTITGSTDVYSLEQAIEEARKG